MKKKKLEKKVKRLEKKMMEHEAKEKQDAITTKNLFLEKLSQKIVKQVISLLKCIIIYFKDKIL